MAVDLSVFTLFLFIIKYFVYFITKNILFNKAFSTIGTTLCPTGKSSLPRWDPDMRAADW